MPVEDDEWLAFARSLPRGRPRKALSKQVTSGKPPCLPMSLAGTCRAAAQHVWPCTFLIVVLCYTHVLLPSHCNCLPASHVTCLT